MLKDMMDDNEKILWMGRPDFFLYVLGNPLSYLYAIIWGIFAYLMFSRSYSIFKWIYLLPVCILLLESIARATNCHAVEYAITDKRSYISSGIFGKDVTIIEHRFVEHLTVNVNLLENLKHVGTIKLTPDTVAWRGDKRTTIQGHRFLAIEEPYKVYKMLKKTVLDVTTDQQFPNSYRPGENSGYDTKLKD